MCTQFDKSFCKKKIIYTASGQSEASAEEKKIFLELQFFEFNGFFKKNISSYFSIIFTSGSLKSFIKRD